MADIPGQVWTGLALEETPSDFLTRRLGNRFAFAWAVRQRQWFVNNWILPAIVRVGSLRVNRWLRHPVTAWSSLLPLRRIVCRFLVWCRDVSRPVRCAPTVRVLTSFLDARLSISRIGWIVREPSRVGNIQPRVSGVWSLDRREEWKPWIYYVCWSVRFC